MLTLEEIRLFMDEDEASVKKRMARLGERYYEARHDIRDYRLFYYNSDGDMVEDKARSNVKISHPFFTELVDQATQYILSGNQPFVLSDNPELQAELDDYFNYNDEFVAELSDLISDCQIKGFAYMFALMGENNRIQFECADTIGVIEVEGRFADDKQDHVIYWYVERIDKDGNRVKKIMDWTAVETYFYQQTEDGDIIRDTTIKLNPRPHILLSKGGDCVYGKSFGFIPFFRLDNNKKLMGNLAPIKDLIDDYDLMASSLSNNLIDFDTPIHVVSGFEGDNLDELQQNLKTKKIVGVGEGGGIDIKTVDVPHEARQTKLELDEKNIYRFGMGLNMAGLKDSAGATTNVAIKAAYSLLDLRCNRLETKVKRFLRQLVKVVVNEINEKNGTAYQADDVYFDFKHEILSNEAENIANDKTEAERKQLEINTLLSLNNVLDDETVMRGICELLDFDYESLKDKLPESANAATEDVNSAIDAVNTMMGG